MTLTQTAILVKQLVAVSAITLILLIGGFIGYRVWLTSYLASLPPVEEKPDTRFGLLPELDFPKSAVSTSNYSYSLDTVTGGLPKVGVDPGFEKVIKVYFVTQTFASFLAPERAQDLAGKFGIISDPKLLSDTKYSYQDANKNLLVDLNNGNFTYTKVASISATIEPENDEKVISDFKQVLSSLGELNINLADTKIKVSLLKWDGGKFIPADTPPDTHAIEVSLWPGSIDNKTIFTPNYNKGLVTANIIGNANLLDNYVFLQFVNYPVDTSTYATYPTKSSETAFEDLKNGKGQIIVKPDKPQVSITSVTLGYYLPERYSPYLQPIFVFEGPGFVAYVPAVDAPYKTSATQN